MQKRALPFLQNDRSISYKKTIKMSGKSTENVSSYRSLCIKLTFNEINPSFIKDIFKLKITNRQTWEKYKLNLEIPWSNQVRFGTKSLTCLGPKVRNSLPYHIKGLENLTIFKTFIKNCNGTVCICMICKKGKYTLSGSFFPL